MLEREFPSDLSEDRRVAPGQDERNARRTCLAGDQSSAETGRAVEEKSRRRQNSYRNRVRIKRPMNGVPANVGTSWFSTFVAWSASVTFEGRNR